jgi:RNA polymerase sigma-70 factor (ECF subfamily)
VSDPLADESMGGLDNAEGELELIRRAVAGETGALKLLLLEAHSRLCSFVGRRIPADLRATLDAEDVVQEAYAQVFRRIGQFQPHGATSFRRWLSTIALRKLRNAVARQRAAKRGGGVRVAAVDVRTREESCVALLDLLAAPGPTPSRCVARQEAVQAVETALAHLPEHYRQALWLTHFEGWPAARAAAEMGRTERALHGLCRRALKLLRDRLGSRSDFLSSSD